MKVLNGNGQSVLATIGIVFSFLLVSAVAPCWAQNPQTKSFSRRYDPVVISGAKLSHLKGMAISQLRLFALQNKTAVPIPFQLDERDDQDSYIYTQGAKAKVRDPQDRQFPEGSRRGPFFDDNDELVFMARDCGERASQGYTFPGFPFVSEIIVTDPLSGSQGFVYFLAYADEKSAPPLSSVSYVQYLPAEEKVIAVGYQAAFSLKTPVFPSYIALPGRLPNKSGNVSWEAANNLIDRFKFRFTVKALGGRLNLIKKDEDDFVGKTMAYKVGPIRVLRLINNSLKVMWGMRSPHISMESVVYPYLLEMPVSIYWPMTLKGLVTSFSIRGSLDFINAANWNYINNQNHTPIIISGRGAEEAGKLSKDYDFSWFALEGESGLFVVRVDLDAKSQEIIKRQVYFVDDPLSMDPPENTPGQSPDLGVNLIGWEQITSGRRSVTARIMLIPGARLGEERQLLNIHDHPVAITILIR